MRQTQRGFPKEPQDIEGCRDVHKKENVKQIYRYCVRTRTIAEGRKHERRQPIMTDLGTQSSKAGSSAFPFFERLPFAKACSTKQGAL